MKGNSGKILLILNTTLSTQTYFVLEIPIVINSSRNSCGQCRLPKWALDGKLEMIGKLDDEKTTG
jgi:hypothetical protein